MRFAVARPREESLACLALAMRFLVRAAFGDPLMKFVAIKKIVCAEYDGRSRAILKLEEGHAMAHCRTALIQRAQARANAAYSTSEQPHDLDLMRDLIEGDPAARCTVEFVRAVRAQ